MKLQMAKKATGKYKSRKDYSDSELLLGKEYLHKYKNKVLKITGILSG
jgi:hypothetical protein